MLTESATIADISLKKRKRSDGVDKIPTDFSMVSRCRTCGLLEGCDKTAGQPTDADQIARLL